MHGDEDFRIKIGEGTDCLLRVHVDVPAAGGVVGADGHERDIDAVALADFREAIEVGAVAAVEYALATGVDDVAAVVAVGVVDIARAPVMAGGMDDAHAADLQLIPDLHLVDRWETEFPDKRGAAHGDDDALAGLQDFQARLVEVVEVGVGDEHQIHLGDAVEGETRVALAFHRTVPLRPIRIDDDGVPSELEEEGGVADPGDADAVGIGRGEDRLEDTAAHFPEHPGDDVVAEKFRVAPGPALLRGEA